MQMALRFGAFGGLGAIIGGEADIAAWGKATPSKFLQVKGSAFEKDGKPFRNIGANIPDLFVQFLHGEDAGATQTLKNAASVGIKVVRCFGCTWGWDDFQIFINDRSKWLTAYDRMLKRAEDNGIGLVPSLQFNMDMIPTYLRKYKGLANEQTVNFLTPGTPSNNLAVEYITAIVQRYAANPTVSMWEIGNEYNLAADLSAQWKTRPANEIPTSTNIRDFLHQMAALIRKLDKVHPITSGNSDMRSYAWHIRNSMLKHQNDPNPLDYPMDWNKDTLEEYGAMLQWFDPSPLNVVCVHEYPVGKDIYSWLKQDDQHDLILPYTKKVADAMQQPIFVGEFGDTIFKSGKEVVSPFVLDVLRQVREGVAPIAAIWAWEFNNGDPAQNNYSLSLDRTPRLAAMIKETNAALIR
jgi:hypothetical protein